MAYSVNTLVEALRDEPESMWVRLVAHWLTDGDPGTAAPSSAGSDIGDALVAAAVAHRADTLGSTTNTYDDSDTNHGHGNLLESATTDSNPCVRERPVTATEPTANWRPSKTRSRPGRPVPSPVPARAAASCI